MASSIFGQQGGNSILQTIGQLRNASGGDIRAACNLLDQAGITRTLPNGQTVTASQLADMVQNQTPQQAFQSMGLDYNEALNFLR